MKKNALIIGAGVNGLSTALSLINAGFQVTLWSKEPVGTLPHASASAYAMWVPVRIATDPRIERWANETFLELERLANDEETGVVMRQIFMLKTEFSVPWYSGLLSNFRYARPGEVSAQYVDAHVLDMAPVIEPVTYLNWLRRQLIAGGAKFEQRPVLALLACPAEFDIVINCAGLGAREIAGDTTVFPERIQVVTIRANGFDKVVIDDEGPHKRACVVPHRDYIKLGAVFDGRKETLEVDDDATIDILSRCNRMVPDLQARRDDIINVVRVLRAERSLPRVEAKLSDGQLIIHNYGHDGMGYILAHGIAAHIADLVQAL